MGLTGKRTPGQPFLDIAAGWKEGDSGGVCYACPVVDEHGNFLITTRNAEPLYDKNRNQGCDIDVKWRPGHFQEPGLSGLNAVMFDNKMIGANGVEEFILEKGLLDPTEMTTTLYYLAAARDIPEAKSMG